MCHNLTGSHWWSEPPPPTQQKKTSESYRENTDHVHSTMNRCRLVLGHHVHVKHDEWMHGDLCS